MIRSLRLGVRTRLLLAVVGAVAIALVIGVASFDMFLEARLRSSAVALARAKAVAELSSVDVVNGELVSPVGIDTDTAVGGPFWVFVGTTNVKSPRVPASWTTAASSLAGGPERTIQLEESVRLYALPVVDGGTRIGTIVAGVSLAPYEETETIAFVGSSVLAVTLLIAVAVLTHWILGKALLPVSRMTEDAAAWSEHDPDRRFDQGEPYDEQTRLASTLDALLERLAASLRYEQRFTAELSHELRTPLAKIAAETELALRRDRSSDGYRTSLEAVRRNALQMTRTVEALVAAARQEAGLTPTKSDAREGIQAAVTAIREEATANDMEVQLMLPDRPVPVAIETDLLERIIQPLLDNALRYGRSQLSVELSVNRTMAVVDVRDTGAGVARGETDLIFEPGKRGSAAADDSRGAGLGLALARRLARSAGGEIVAEANGSGGRFSIHLPLA